MAGNRWGTSKCVDPADRRRVAPRLERSSQPLDTRLHRLRAFGSGRRWLSSTTYVTGSAQLEVLAEGLTHDL